MVEMPDLKTQFEISAAEAQSLPTKPDNSTLLKLYAFYKQATVGDLNSKRPGFMDPVGQAKYDAWQRIKGMKKEVAMQAYIDLVKKLKS